MYVENIKMGLIALGVVLVLIFVVTVPMFLAFYHTVRYVVRTTKEEWGK